MNSIIKNATRVSEKNPSIHYKHLLKSFLTGLLIPCGFAPFHLPGLTILGIALLFSQLNSSKPHKAFLTGWAFGVGYFLLGISWLYVSVNQYGQLNPLLSAGITVLFVFYLAIFPGVITLSYHVIKKKNALLINCLIFSALWSIGEYLRSTLFGGFPWLMLGVGQIDSPFRYLLPIIGVFGVSFLCCLSATLLATAMKQPRQQRWIWISSFALLIILPNLLKHKQWTQIGSSSLSVGVIQSNISMKNKWDERLFWKTIEQYERKVNHLIGKKQVIVMPESAIPVPMNYLTDLLDKLSEKAKEGHSAILLGIPQASSKHESSYYNTLTSLGAAQGIYLKQQLVPFGEYIPQIFQSLFNWLSLPTANLISGEANQALISVQNDPIATLICYEVAYPHLIRNQLPEARWIVSISDDGWFGRSLAMYQQLQMAQVLSLLTGRYQIVANNDGLSSIINSFGFIEHSLPPYASGILEATIKGASGMPPWVKFGDSPMITLSVIICALAFLAKLGVLLPSRRRINSALPSNPEGDLDLNT